MKFKFIFTVLSVLSLAACQPKQPAATLSLDPVVLDFATAGGEQTISLKSNTEWSVTGTDGIWFTYDPSTGSGNATIVVAATENAGAKRSGSIKFATKGGVVTTTLVINQEASEDNPNLPDNILKETFATSQGSFTIKDEKKPSELDYIWISDPNYKCMKASAYKDNTNYDAESWLISPEIDLTERAYAYLSFSHAGNFFDTAKIKEQNLLMVTADNGANWDKIEIPNHHSGSSWSFVDSGSIDLGTKYKGKKIKIAFVYKGSSAKSGTWEIKNVLISRNTTADVGNTYKGVPVWMEMPEVTNKETFHIHAAMEGGRKYRNYSMNYDEKHLVATWTAYPLCDWYTKANVNRDDFDWTANPFVEVQAKMAKAGDWYNPNGYERGHQIASADRRVNAAMQQQTFYYTNAAPMHKGTGFNSGIWGTLEDKVRDWSKKSAGTDTLYVVTGAIVEEGLQTVKDNDDKLCTVPKAYYKALLRYDKDGSTNKGYMAAGFYLEHKTGNSGSVINYSMSIKELEAKTGMKFFVNLDKAVGAETATKIKNEKPKDNSFWK